MSAFMSADVLGAWDTARIESIKLPVDSKAAHLLDTIGPRIAAASLGMADARQLKRWASDREEPRSHAVAERLDALYWIVRAIEQVYSVPVAVRFLRAANPQLHDEAPLLALATASGVTEIGRVLSATRAFLDG